MFHNYSLVMYYKIMLEYCQKSKSSPKTAMSTNSFSSKVNQVYGYRESVYKRAINILHAGAMTAL